MPSYKRIGIVVKREETGVGDLVRRLTAVIASAGGEALVEDAAAAQVPGDAAPARLAPEDVFARADLVVVLGGDGTMLSAVRALGERAVPVLGIHHGHLGFLTGVDRADGEQVLRAILEGRGRVLERARLVVEVVRRGQPVFRDLCLNDAVVNKGSALARMVEFDTTVDGRGVATVRADGLIVSTPTGSTAYNLSAGGPILEPSVEGIVITPICPHTLTLRPLVVPDDRVLEIRLLSNEEAALTLDGQVGAALEAGDCVRVAAAAQPARFAGVDADDPYHTLRAKLGWGSR